MSNPIWNITRSIVTKAIDAEATGVQIRLEENRMVVYHEYEDGAGQAFALPGQLFPPVTTRYKLWADVDLLNRRFPLKGQFALIHRRRQYTVDTVWHDPRQDPRVTLSIVAGAEAEEDDDNPGF